MATYKPTIDGLGARGYVVPCDHHVAVFFHSGVWHHGPLRHFYGLTPKGRDYLARLKEIDAC